MIIKHLLSATAVVALVGVAHAQDAVPADPNAATQMELQPGVSAHALFIATPTMGAHLASRLIGEEVYNANTAEADTIGQINDLIIADTGEVEAVVIGVGGFLGVGEHTVAVDFDQLAWSHYQDGDHREARLVLAATPEQLQAAPAFDVSQLEADPVERLYGDPAQTTAMTQDGTVGQEPMPAQPQELAQDQPAQDPMVAPGADTGFTDVDIATISANDLLNATVYSANDENVGSVNDVLLSDDGAIDAVVLDIGGFLGIGAKPVAIAFEDLTIRRDQNNNLFVYTSFTRDQLEMAPDYDADAYLTNRDIMRLQTAN